MNKGQLIDELASETKQTKVAAKNFLDAFMRIVPKAVKKDKLLTLVGFGTFKTVKRKQTVGVNPKTKEKIDIPAKTTMTFKVSKALIKELFPKK